MRCGDRAVQFENDFIPEPPLSWQMRILPRSRNQDLDMVQVDFFRGLPVDLIKACFVASALAVIMADDHG